MVDGEALALLGVLPEDRGVRRLFLGRFAASLEVAEEVALLIPDEVEMLVGVGGEVRLGVAFGLVVAEVGLVVLGVL